MPCVILFVGFLALRSNASPEPPAADQAHSYTPVEGFVPDEATAIKIAVAVWIPIYGESKIKREKPYIATLQDGVWTVEGSLPKHRFGGVAIAEIAKADARIIRVSHGM